jgi:serine/threonine protein kinase
VKELGRGGFSIVFRATHRIDGCEYALKRTKNPVSDNKDRNAWLQVSTEERQQLPVLWAPVVGYSVEHKLLCACKILARQAIPLATWISL